MQLASYFLDFNVPSTEQGFMQGKRMTHPTLLNKRDPETACPATPAQLH